MNKRIEGLKGKALDQAVPYTWHHLNHVQIDDVMKKFAELIVQECIEQVWYSREDGINGNVSEVIKDRIKKHFGVSE
jgi:hypothetical protein